MASTPKQKNTIMSQVKCLVRTWLVKTATVMAEPPSTCGVGCAKGRLGVTLARSGTSWPAQRSAFQNHP